MAKALEIPGLDCTGRSLDWVRHVLFTRFDETAGFRAAALDFSDAGGVHDIRVAMRRLRSVLRDVKSILDREPLAEIKKDLKRLSDALGVVRDADVQLGALEEMLDEAENGDVRPGIEAILENRRAERDGLRRELTGILAEERIADLQKRFRETVNTAIGKSGSQDISFEDGVGRAAAANLEEMLDLGPKIYKPFKRNGLHKLRIAAKRLRYSLQLFALCRGREAKAAAKEIAKLQKHLGELHDCDIWINDLGEMLAGEGGQPAAARLLAQFVRKQNKEYLSALALWEEWRKNNLARRVREVISLA